MTQEQYIIDMAAKGIKVWICETCGFWNFLCSCE